MSQAEHITLEGVKAAARKAYDENRLLAQHPEIDDYFYRRGDIGCAIGVGLSQETADKISKRKVTDPRNNQLVPLDGKNFSFLISFKDILEVKKCERQEITDIQTAHDSWKNHSRHLVGDRLLSYRQRFLELIDHPNG